MNKIEVIELRKRSIQMEGIGEWDWSNDQRKVICTSDAIGYVEHSTPEGFIGKTMKVFRLRESKFVIGVEEYGVIVWKFDSETGRIEPLAPLYDRERLDNGYKYEMAVSNDKHIALYYERGVLLFDENIALRWRRDHFLLNWFFQRITNTEVEYKDDWDNRWAYKLENGAIIGQLPSEKQK